jgi:hypothetical protein
MKNLIRIVVGTLVVCGALVAVGGVAEAREPERAGVAHVERRHDGFRDGRHFERGHDRGWYARGRDCRRGWR